MFGANTASTLGSLLLPMPDRTADVELRVLEVHVGPFQSQSLSNPQTRQVQKDNQSLEMFWRVVRNGFDFSRGKGRLLSTLYSGFRNTLNRVRVQQFQSNCKVEHLLQKHIEVQQRLRLKSPGSL